MRHRLSIGLLAVFGVLAVVSSAPWTLLASSAAGRSGDQTSPPVARLAPDGLRPGAEPGKKGATYFGLESQAVRQTARFPELTAVTDRGFDGALRTVLADAGGTEVATFKLDRVDGSADVLSFTRGGRTVRILGNAAARPTLDWSTKQAYVLWRDRAEVEGARFEWRGEMVRIAAGAELDVERSLAELQTEWSSGLTTKTVRQSVSRHPIPGRVVSGAVLVTRLSRSGTELGLANWYPSAQVFMWTIPGLTKGYIAPEHLGQFSGWPFAPDMAWLNLQLTAFHHYKSRILEKGFVAERAPTWVDRLVQRVTPTLQANEPGCDDLHWLDGTVFRFCCDIHDRCYERIGCTSRSWWRFWSSWNCTACNVGAIYCFMSGGYDYPDGGFRQ